METLIWIGAAISLIGIAGLGWCVLRAMAARRSGLDDAAMRKRLQGLVALNLGALLLSMLGLTMVVVGIFLAP
ncbi:hypothetical protein [Profundibacterium mesophilum]|uniref:Uncharacterized protein n=1 Tax=Profundibacterium mesophilum KAUST100406-0324 TaxID=1037889 RepID=A0A921NT54_9RHOB|nr:hypothetical protein [Profundibacterium mesophilum]KAF0675018.1 hypothetical protein PMES_02727 [Profundibacterium mesophilum KAUST100406-0324]